MIQSHPERQIAYLRERGVVIPHPDLVAIGAEVRLEQIAAKAVLHPFSQVRGKRSRIDAGAIIGEGGPATLEDCWVGTRAEIGTMGPVTLRNVTAGPGTVLGSGAAEDAVFLGKEVADPAISAGLAFRVRRGSLYEEDANSAQHTDTKMTVLFPWVTLGSNVNWCDLLMAGGTGPGFDQFSEVGSGAVHFNFTPRGDKATGTLLGDVPAGVFLRAQRIFFGGNGSLLGPAQLAYGAVTAAAGRYAGPLRPGFNPGLGDVVTPRPDFDPRIYGAIGRVFESQVGFIGQLAALDSWYRAIRARLTQGDADRTELYAAGRHMVELNLGERIRQLGALAARMEDSARLIESANPADPRLLQQRALLDGWPLIKRHLWTRAATAPPPPQALLQAVDESAEQHGPYYTQIVGGISVEGVALGRAWLQEIVDRVAAAEILDRVPTLPSASR